MLSITIQIQNACLMADTVSISFMALHRSIRSVLYNMNVRFSRHVTHRG
jgi:hypothetical protein